MIVLQESNLDSYNDLMRTVGSGNASQLPLHVGAGYLGFLIVDLNMNGLRPASVCYDAGRATQYQSQSCPSESADFASLHRQAPIAFHGSGKGFDFRLVGPSIVWGPVIDHQNGVYSVRVRVEDPGQYTAEVHVNDQAGCQYADCDTPTDVCNRFLDYDSRMAYCSGDGGSARPCFARVADRQVVVGPTPASCQSSTTARPAICDLDRVGTIEGRWVKPEYLSNTPIFGQQDWPFVWQPYDCVIPWPSTEAVERCLFPGSSQFVFIGMSRERTNFFDAAEFGGHEFEHEKLKDAASLANLHYLSVFWPQLEDMKSWNLDSSMPATTQRLKADMEKLGICGDDARPTHILATEESIWVVEHALRSSWSKLSSSFLNALMAACPKARFQYKTATAIPAQHRSLSWQRLWDATGIAADNALHSMNVPVVDSFALTQPLVAERDVFPDGLHLYNKEKHLQGNFVSKTVSMMFLAQSCPEMISGY